MSQKPKKPFLCSFYSPICMQNFPVFVPPCRFLCEAARHGCYPYMKTLGFEWPPELQCDQMPERGENELCLDFNLPRRVIPTQSSFLPASPFQVAATDEPDENGCCNKCQYPSFVEVRVQKLQIISRILLLQRVHHIRKFRIREFSSYFTTKTVEVR